ncbi:MAG: hypothetical protein ACYC7D_04605 [Nitrososphaerales archaeon]
MAKTKPAIRRDGSDTMLFALLFVLVGVLLTVVLGSLPAAIIITPFLYYIWRLSRRVKTLENKLTELDPKGLEAPKDLELKDVNTVDSSDQEPSNR